MGFWGWLIVGGCYIVAGVVVRMVRNPVARRAGVWLELVGWGVVLVWVAVVVGGWLGWLWTGGVVEARSGVPIAAPQAGTIHRDRKERACVRTQLDGVCLHGGRIAPRGGSKHGGSGDSSGHYM